MKRVVATIGTLLALGGCGARRRAAAPGWPLGRESAVHQNMARQVANAWDAGEGDYQLRRLRVKVAAHPADHDARLDLAEAYAAAGAPELALEHVRRVREARPDVAELALREARLWDSAGLPERGLAAAGEFARTHAATAELLLWAGVTHDRRGEWKEGEAAHRAALAADPVSAAAHNNLGYNLLAQDRFDEAVAQLTEAVRLAPASTVARNNLALAHARRNRGPDAGQAFQIWRATQGAVAAHSNLAAVHIEQGRHGRAREELTAALTRQRDFAPALRNLQVVAERDGGPAAVPVARQRAAWINWAASLKRILIGSEESGARPAGVAGAVPPAR